MAYSEEFLRRVVEDRIRQARRTGEREESEFPVRSASSFGLDVRDQSLFNDQTNRTIIGFAVIGTMFT